MNQAQPQTITFDHWHEIEAGFRGSVLLRLGAVVLAAGGLANLGVQLLAGPTGPSPTATIVAWLLHILGLWLLATGFFWVASHPFLTRFGFVVGAFHAVQGLYLLLLLFTFTRVPVEPVSVTVGRLLATLAFALIERDWLPVRTRRLLAVTAGVLLLKAVTRVAGWLPALGAPVEPLLDAVCLLALAAALWQVSVGIRLQEDIWARTAFESSHANFGDFNNPEHAWNKVDPGE